MSCAISFIPITPKTFERLLGGLTLPMLITEIG